MPAPWRVYRSDGGRVKIAPARADDLDSNLLL